MRHGPTLLGENFTDLLYTQRTGPRFLIGQTNFDFKWKTSAREKIRSSCTEQQFILYLAMYIKLNTETGQFWGFTSLPKALSEQVSSHISRGPQCYKRRPLVIPGKALSQIRASDPKSYQERPSILSGLQVQCHIKNGPQSYHDCRPYAISGLQFPSDIMPAGSMSYTERPSVISGQGRLSVISRLQVPSHVRILLLLCIYNQHNISMYYMTQSAI